MVNSRDAKPIIKKMLEDLDFPQGYIWVYGPHHIISKLRKYNKYSAYNHQPKENLEKLANFKNWE